MMEQMYCWSATELDVFFLIVKSRQIILIEDISNKEAC